MIPVHPHGGAALPLQNRLRLVIGSVISESQTAFVKDRQILDGILIANEVVDEARKSKKELMLFKVDFEKAYYSVDWGYLDAVMGRMSFPNLWRKWIKECVCTATASVLVNGSPTDDFPLERGLRQGDPWLPRNRLSGWKSRLLSFGGRLVLLKSVLTSLPVYTLSFFKAHPGLGVRQLRKFNLALLGKWCWRMLVDREGLWYRVLVARYGVERGRLRAGGRRGSSWWREIVRIRDSEGGIRGAWVGKNVSKKVGDRSDTLFWTDPWTDEIPLCERMGAGWEAWVWRRHLRGWEEEMLRECQTLLLNISLQDSVTIHAAESLIWHPQVPLKVSILAWHLLRDRLPTKENLVTRGILSSEAHFCVSGCGAVESAQHLFLSCSTFSSLWSLVSSWVGSSLVVTHTISDHFVQFTQSAGVSRARHSFMQLIWLVSIWVVWNERNSRLFRGSTNSL
ncbi:hypothetical protein TSUD_299100 [Trifolium subterraneum]|nr:hypothetical protein TSUD_299100 [Trifolium subterraneum]